MSTTLDVRLRWRVRMPWGGGMSAHPLSGSVVAVVGATGALGSRIARGAAERGAHVVLVGRDAERLHRSSRVRRSSSGTCRMPGWATGSSRRPPSTTAASTGWSTPPGSWPSAAARHRRRGDRGALPHQRARPAVPPAPGRAGARGTTRVRRAGQRRRGRDPLPGMAAYAASKAALTAADRALPRAATLRGRRHRRAAAAHRDRAGRPADRRGGPALPQGLDPDVVVSARCSTPSRPAEQSWPRRTSPEFSAGGGDEQAPRRHPQFDRDGDLARTRPVSSSRMATGASSRG